MEFSGSAFIVSLLQPSPRQVYGCLVRERACQRALRPTSARGSEAVMGRGAGTKHGGRSIALIVGLLACFGWAGLWASTDDDAHGLIVHRSTRAIPHKFTVHPNGPTIAANQTLRFGVTDAEGRPVAVHWNISGIGCSGLSCGSIDAEGNYRTPASLPKPPVVTLEGVLVSDPNYSVLTEVRLEQGSAAKLIPASAPASARETQLLTAPVVERKTLAASRAELPLPNAVAAAPVVGSQGVARSGGMPPLPNAVAAAPVVGSQSVARSAGMPPLPNVVAAAPVVGSQSVARSGGIPPLPTAVPAPPAVGRETVARNGELPPLPTPVTAAPVVERMSVARSVELPPLPKAASAAAVGGKQTLALIAGLPSLPNGVVAAPGRETVGWKAEVPPLPNAAAAVPAVERQNPARSEELPSLPVVVATATPASQILAGKTQPFTGTAAGRQNAASSAVLLPMPDALAAAPARASVALQHSPMVTYQDGLLTIDVKNSTLAEVLSLIAEKTGAVIDIPPGSGQERIVEHAGPGRAEDVLARLLNGSPYDFVIVGSPQNPRDPTQVLLFPHGGGPALERQDAPLAAAADSEGPQLYGAGFRADPSTDDSTESTESAAVSPTPAPPASGDAASGEAIPPAVLEQMMKDRIHQRQAMYQQQSQANQQPSNPQ
jgi:hypothetical protein